MDIKFVCLFVFVVEMKIEGAILKIFMLFLWNLPKNTLE